MAPMRFTRLGLAPFFTSARRRKLKTEGHTLTLTVPHPVSAHGMHLNRLH